MGFSYYQRKINTFWRFLARSTSGFVSILYTLLTSLNVRISRGLEQSQSLNLAESAQVGSTAKEGWSRGGYEYDPRAAHDPLALGPARRRRGPRGRQQRQRDLRHHHAGVTTSRGIIQMPPSIHM